MVSVSSETPTQLVFLSVMFKGPRRFQSKVLLPFPGADAVNIVFGKVIEWVVPAAGDGSKMEVKLDLASIFVDLSGIIDRAGKVARTTKLTNELSGGSEVIVNLEAKLVDVYGCVGDVKCIGKPGSNLVAVLNEGCGVFKEAEPVGLKAMVDPTRDSRRFASNITELILLTATLSGPPGVGCTLIPRASMTTRLPLSVNTQAKWTESFNWVIPADSADEGVIIELNANGSKTEEYDIALSSVLKRTRIIPDSTRLEREIGSEGVISVLIEARLLDILGESVNTYSSLSISENSKDVVGLENGWGVFKMQNTTVGSWLDGDNPAKRFKETNDALSVPSGQLKPPRFSYSKTPASTPPSSFRVKARAFSNKTTNALDIKDPRVNRAIDQYYNCLSSVWAKLGC